MKKPSLREFTGHAQGHSGHHPPGCEAPARPLALPSWSQTAPGCLLTQAVVPCCSQPRFREVMSPVPEDTCLGADSADRVVNGLCAACRGSGGATVRVVTELAAASGPVSADVC